MCKSWLYLSIVCRWQKDALKLMNCKQCNDRMYDCLLHPFAWMSTAKQSSHTAVTQSLAAASEAAKYDSDNCVSLFCVKLPLSGRVHRVLVLTRVESRWTGSPCSSLVGHGPTLVAGGGAVHAALVGRTSSLPCNHRLLGLLGVVAGVHWTVVREVCWVRLKDCEYL